MSMGYDFDTSAVHAGREDFLELGVHAAPLDFSSTYPIPDLEEGTASLEALALTHQPALAAAGLDAVEVLVDARMGELYRATFALRDGGLAYGEEDQITTVEALGERPPLPPQWGLIGDGQSLPLLPIQGQTCQQFLHKLAIPNSSAFTLQTG